MSSVSAIHPSLSRVTISPLLSNVEILFTKVAFIVIISLTKNFFDKDSRDFPKNQNELSKLLHKLNNQLESSSNSISSKDRYQTLMPFEFLIK